MPSKTQSILLGGLVAGILSTSVLGLINVLCCAGVIIGALVSVWHYTTTYDLTIPAGQGVLIGVLAGGVGALVAGLLNWLVGLVGLDLTTLVIRVFENSGAPQEQLDLLRQQAQNQGWGDALLGIVFSVVVYAVVGAIGGAIGASAFKRGGDTPGGPPGGSSGGGATGGGPSDGPRSGPAPGRAPMGEEEAPSQASREEPAQRYRPVEEKEESVSR